MRQVAETHVLQLLSAPKKAPPSLPDCLLLVLLFSIPRERGAQQLLVEALDARC